MWSNKMDDLDADEEWSDDEYVRTKSYSEKHSGGDVQNRSTTSKHPPTGESFNPDTDPISLILSKIDAELSAMKERDVMISANHNGVDMRYQTDSVRSSPVSQQLSLHAHHQSELAMSDTPETARRSSNIKFADLSNEKQQPGVSEPRNEYNDATPSDNERDRKSNSDTPRDLDPFSAQEMDKKFKEIMLKKKGRTASPLTARINSWTTSRPATNMLSTGYGTDSESVRTEDFEAKFMGMMVQPSEGEGRVVRSANTRTAPDSFGRQPPTDGEPTSQGFGFKPRPIITTRPRSLSPRRTSVSSQSKENKPHQVRDSPTQQLQKRTNQLFSWDDVFWKDNPKRGPQSVTSTTSTFEEVESLCLSKRSSDSMGSSHQQWSRITGSDHDGFSWNRTSPGRRLTSTQSSVTSSPKSRFSALGYDAPTGNRATAQRVTDTLLESLEFINSHSNLDLAEKIFLENLLQRVLDHDAQPTSTATSSSSSSLNEFFRDNNNIYQSPHSRTPTNNHHPQSVNSNKRQNGMYLPESKEQSHLNTGVSSQKNAHTDKKRGRDLILPDDDSSSRERIRQPKSKNNTPDSQLRRVSDSTSDGTMSSHVLSTDSHSRTTAPSTGMDSGNLREALQFNSVSQQAFHPNIATYLPANSFPQRGSLERTATPPEPYVFNQPFSTSHAERVLMGLGFSSAEGFLPERFLKDWYDKIAKAQMVALAEIKERESFDSQRDNNSRPMSRKQSLSSISVDYGSGQYPQANRHQRFDPPAQDEHVTAVLPSSNDISKLERLNEYVASFYKRLSPREDAREVRTKQFASSRQNSLPLLLEACSEAGNGGKSRIACVDPNDRDAKLEIFLSELLANKKKYSKKVLKQINARLSGNDSQGNLAKMRENNTDEDYAQYNSVNKTRNNDQANTTQESPRHKSRQSNGKHDGFQEESVKSKEQTSSNKDNLYSFPRAYSPNKKMSPIRQTAFDSHLIASLEEDGSSTWINEVQRAVDGVANNTRSENNQRKQIIGRTEKRPDKTQSVQSIDGMEVADIMVYQNHEGDNKKEDDKVGHIGTRNPALKHVEPAMVSIVLEDVDQDQSESSFDFPSGSFERSLLGIPSSRRTSMSLSPIPQSPVTVIEVSLDNQQDSLDTEGTGSSKDTDDDITCENSSVLLLDESTSHTGRSSRVGSLSTQVERLKRTRSPSFGSTVNKKYVVNNNSTESTHGPSQRRLSLEVPLVPELRQALERQKIQKIHDLHKSSDEQMKEGTRSTSLSLDSPVGTDETRSNIASPDSTKLEMLQPRTYVSIIKRNEIVDNNTSIPSTDSPDLPEFSGDGGSRVHNISKPRSGYDHQYLNHVRTGASHMAAENSPTSLNVHNPGYEYIFSASGRTDLSPESLKSAFRDARQTKSQHISGSSAGYCSETDVCEFSCHHEHLMANNKSDDRTTSIIGISSDISNSSPSSVQHSATCVSHPWYLMTTKEQTLSKPNDYVPRCQTAEENKDPPWWDPSLYYYVCDREAQCDMPNWTPAAKRNIGVNYFDKFTQTGIPKFEMSCQTTDPFVNVDSAKQRLAQAQRHSRTKAVNTVLCLSGQEQKNEINLVNFPDDIMSERTISNFSIVDETLQLIDAELLSIRKKEFERLTIPTLNPENQFFHRDKPACILCAAGDNTGVIQDELLMGRNIRLSHDNLANECTMKVYAPLSWDDATRGVGISDVTTSSNIIENNIKLFVHKNNQVVKASQMYTGWKENKFTHDLNYIPKNVSESIPTDHLQELTRDCDRLLSANSFEMNEDNITGHTTYASTSPSTCASSKHQNRPGRHKRKQRKVSPKEGHLHTAGVLASDSNMSTKANVNDFQQPGSSNSSNCDTRECKQQNAVAPFSVTCSRRTSCLVCDEISKETDNLLHIDHPDASHSCFNTELPPEIQQVPHKALDSKQRDNNHAKLSRLRYRSTNRTSSSSLEIESDFMSASHFGIILPTCEQSGHQDVTDLKCAGYSLVQVDKACGSLQEQQLTCPEISENAFQKYASTTLSSTYKTDHEEKDVHSEDTAKEKIIDQEQPLAGVINSSKNTLKEYATDHLTEEPAAQLKDLSDNSDHTKLDKTQPCSQIDTSTPLARADIPEILISRADSSDSLQLPYSPTHLFQKAALPSSPGCPSSSESSPVHLYTVSKSNCPVVPAEAVNNLCDIVTINNTENEEDTNYHKHIGNTNDMEMIESALLTLSNSITPSDCKTVSDMSPVTGMKLAQLEFNDENFQFNCSVDSDAGSDSKLSCESNHVVCPDSLTSPPLEVLETHHVVFEVDGLNIGHEFMASCSSGRSYPHSLDVSSNRSIAGSDCSLDVDDMDVLIEEARHRRYCSSSSYSEPVLDISDSLSDDSLSSIGSRDVVNDKPLGQIYNSGRDIVNDTPEGQIYNSSRDIVNDAPSDHIYNSSRDIVKEAQGQIYNSIDIVNDTPEGQIYNNSRDIVYDTPVGQIYNNSRDIVNDAPVGQIYNNSRDIVNDAPVGQIYNNSRDILNDAQSDHIYNNNVNFNQECEWEESSRYAKIMESESSMYPDLPTSATSDNQGRYTIPHNFKSSSEEQKDDTGFSNSKLNETTNPNVSPRFNDFPYAHLKYDNDAKNHFEFGLSVHCQNENNPGCTSHNEEISTDRHCSHVFVDEQSANNKFINEAVVGHGKDNVPRDRCHGTLPKTHSDKDNSTVSNDHVEKDVYCISMPLTEETADSQDHQIPMLEETRSEANSSVSDSRPGNNICKDNINATSETVLIDQKNVSNTGGVMEIEVKPCGETAANTHQNMQPETSNILSEHSTNEDPKKDRISRLAYLARHYPSIAPQESTPGLASAADNPADSNTPPYQYWQASSESSSVTFTLSEISEEETPDEDSTSGENRNEVSPSHSNSKSLKNIYFEEDSNFNEASFTVRPLEGPPQEPALERRCSDQEYIRESDISPERHSESNRYNTPAGTDHLQNLVSTSRLSTSNFNNSRSFNGPQYHTLHENILREKPHDFTSSDKQIQPFIGAPEVTPQIGNISPAMDVSVGKFPGRNPTQEIRILAREVDACGNITSNKTVSYLRRTTYYNSPYIHQRDLITNSLSDNLLDNNSYVSLAALSIGDYRQGNEVTSLPSSRGALPVDNVDQNDVREGSRRRDTKSEGHGDITTNITDDPTIYDNDNLESFFKCDTISNTCDLDKSFTVSSNAEFPNSFTGDTGISSNGYSCRRNTNGVLSKSSLGYVASSGNSDDRTSLTYSDCDFSDNILSSNTDLSDNIVSSNADVSKYFTSDNVVSSYRDLSKFDKNKKDTSSSDDLSMYSTREKFGSTWGDVNSIFRSDNDVVGKGGVTSPVNIARDWGTSGFTDNGDSICVDEINDGSDSEDICSRNGAPYNEGSSGSSTQDNCIGGKRNDCSVSYYKNDVNMQSIKQRDNYCNDKLFRAENNGRDGEMNGGPSGEVSSCSGVSLESAGSNHYNNGVESEAPTLTRKVTDASDDSISNDATTEYSKQINQEKRRRFLKQKFRHLFTRDHSKKEDTESDSSRVYVGSYQMASDIHDQTVSSVTQTVSSISQTISCVLREANSRNIEDLLQEIRSKYFLGGTNDNWNTGRSASASEESDNKFEELKVPFKIVSFGETTYGKAATEGSQNYNWSQDSQYTSVENTDSWISNGEESSANNIVDETMRFELDNENDNNVNEISTTEATQEQVYDSSVKRSVKVTTMFSNSVGKSSKSLLISEPPSGMRIKQGVHIERQDSTGCCVGSQSLRQCCQGEERGVSDRTDGLATHGVKRLRSRDSLLSLHQCVDISSSIEGNDDVIFSALENCGDYDIRTMGMGTRPCISVDSDGGRSGTHEDEVGGGSRALEDGAGGISEAFEEGAQNRLHLGASSEATHGDNTVEVCRERNISQRPTDINNRLIHKMENGSGEGCSMELSAPFTVTYSEYEERRDVTSEHGLEDSMRDPCGRFSIETKIPDHHTTGVTVEPDDTVKRASRLEISGTLTEPEEERLLVDKCLDRQDYLPSLEQTKTRSCFSSLSLGEGQTTHQTTHQSGRQSEKTNDSLPPELTSLETLAQVNQQTRVMPVPSERRQSIEIVWSSKEIADAEPVAEDIPENTLKRQDSRSDKSGLGNQKTVLTETSLRQKTEDPNTSEETGGISSLENVSVLQKGVQGTQPNQQSSDLDEIDNVILPKLDGKMLLKPEDVTTQILGVVFLKQFNDVKTQELDVLVSPELYDVSTQELDELVPHGCEDVTTQELDALIPHGCDDVTTEELDELVAQEENSLTSRELDGQFIKKIHSEHQRNKNDGAQSPLLTDSEIAVQIDKNTSRVQTSENYERMNLEQLPATLEVLHLSDTERERQSLYMKSLSVTSRDSGFDSHGSPVDITYKVQEQIYSAFTDPTLELSF